MESGAPTNCFLEVKVMAGYAVLLMSKALRMIWALLITKDHESNVLVGVGKDKNGCNIPFYICHESCFNSRFLFYLVIKQRRSIFVYIHSFIHSFSKYLWSTSSILGLDNRLVIQK